MPREKTIEDLRREISGLIESATEWANTQEDPEYLLMMLEPPLNSADLYIRDWEGFPLIGKLQSTIEQLGKLEKHELEMRKRNRI